MRIGLQKKAQIRVIEKRIKQLKGYDQDLRDPCFAQCLIDCIKNLEIYKKRLKARGV